MMEYTIGSLFSGYGGLDIGVQLALGPARVAWVSDIDPGPMKILAHRHPDAPNLGDVTRPDIGLTHRQQLRALGNGVVPQQAAAAISLMAQQYRQIGRGCVA